MQKKDSHSLEVIDTKLEYIQADISDIKKRMESDYVTQDEFDPIKRLVYGLVSIILVAVVGGLLALVVK